MIHTSPPDTPPSYDPDLEPIRIKFRAGFQDHILAIESLKKEVRDSNSPEAMAQISSRVHNIAGVADTLGFPNIGSISCTLEAEINSEVQKTVSPADLLVRAATHIEDLLDVLEVELD